MHIYMYMHIQMFVQFIECSITFKESIKVRITLARNQQCLATVTF